jgi:antitoxin component of MazEF toxin-antitoxin module
MITRIQKWGNGLGVRLSKDVLAAAHIEIGDEVRVAARAGALVIAPFPSVPGGVDLGRLVLEIPADYEPEGVRWQHPAGREVW